MRDDAAAGRLTVAVLSALVIAVAGATTTAAYRGSLLAGRADAEARNGRYGAHARHRAFAGGHSVPTAISRAVVRWFLG